MKKSASILFFFLSLFFCQAQENNAYQKWYQHEGTYDFGNGEKILGVSIIKKKKTSES